MRTVTTLQDLETTRRPPPPPPPPPPSPPTSPSDTREDGGHGHDGDVVRDRVDVHLQPLSVELSSRHARGGGGGGRKVPCDKTKLTENKNGTPFMELILKIRSRSNMLYFVFVFVFVY